MWRAKSTNFAQPFKTKKSKNNPPPRPQKRGVTRRERSFRATPHGIRRSSAPPRSLTTSPDPPLAASHPRPRLAPKTGKRDSKGREKGPFFHTPIRRNCGTIKHLPQNATCPPKNRA